MNLQKIISEKCANGVEVLPVQMPQNPTAQKPQVLVRTNFADIREEKEEDAHRSQSARSGAEEGAFDSKRGSLGKAPSPPKHLE